MFKIIDDPTNRCPVKNVKCPGSLTEKIHVPSSPNYQYSFTVGKLGRSVSQIHFFFKLFFNETKIFRCGRKHWQM